MRIDPTRVKQFGPWDSMETARQEFALMVEYKRAGKTVVIASDEVIPIGGAVIRVEAGEALVKQTTTRREFERHNRGTALAQCPRMAFYYELEIVCVS